MPTVSAFWERAYAPGPRGMSAVAVLLSGTALSQQIVVKRSEFGERSFSSSFSTAATRRAPEWRRIRRSSSGPRSDQPGFFASRSAMRRARSVHCAGSIP